MSSVGEVIERHREEILHLWEQGAGQADAAGNMCLPDLVNVMPAYISSLGQMAEEDLPRVSASQQELIEAHLANRLRHWSDMNQIVTEFAILGRCLSSILDAEPADERPPLRDVARLFAELYAAISAVTRIFNRHMLEDQQREARYARLLRRIAGAVLDAPAPATVPTRELLTDVLTVVTAAVTAQSGALLLFDAHTDLLIASASVGNAAQHLEQLAGSLEAVSAGATSAWSGNAGSQMLDVSDELRQAGIQSLLGVRLPGGQLVRGTLLVGISDAREFLAREISCIEDMAASLMLQLDNARLRVVLGEKDRDIALEGGLRERFVSVLMHDLTGPLRAAKAGAVRLREPWTLDDPQQTAAVVVRELERMDWMVRGLLDVHRIRAGQQLPLRIEECDLRAVASAAIEELRAEHGARLVLQGDRWVRGMWCPEQLRRAIWNLAVNGIEHGAAHRPVTIAIAAGPAGAELSVHNEGPAIALEEQAALFHPFSLPGSAMHGPRCGWGLGLTFVWGCVEAHGGKVIVDSRAGRGTTFRMLLPYDSRPYAQ